MMLPAGVRLGPYEILGPLGAGGMGEVYRARDIRLDRTVALKVLPPHLAEDPQLRQRFEREARTISSLNHPNICSLYDVGEAPDPTAGDDRTSPATADRQPISFLVMELVEGDTLSARLAKGPLPLDQALRRGIEIIDALTSAHRRGIVHRDVKPGNVMLTKAGAKLLDFGLAKSAGVLAGVGPHAETAATVSPADVTVRGTILGTLQYMAPEQLEGLEADHRTDIFAFGTTLFEMLTGRKAFVAATQASLIGAVLKDDPPAPSTLQPVVPAALDRVIGKCLAKDPDQRWQDASDLRDELQWIADGGLAPGAPTPVRRTREWLAWALFAAASAAAVALAVPAWRTPPSPPVVRFALAPPEGVQFAPVGAPVAPFPAVSPDGRRLIFVAARSGEAPSLWLQSFDSLAARPLDGTTVRTDTLSPALPFWSPDGRSVGFFADGKLKRIDVDGGAPQTICDAEQSGGGSWGADGTIIFASRIDDGLYKVSAAGGAPVPVTKPDAARGEISHSNPAFLPDGRHFLYWVQAPRPSIRVGSVDSFESAHLFESDSRAAYASGYVFAVRQSTLFAHPFDTARLVTTGEPVPIAEGVRTFPLNGRSAFSLSSEGVLVYRTGITSVTRTLVWYDRRGQTVATVPNSVATYSGISLSGDDRRLIAQIEDGSGSDLWLIDLEDGARSRITADPKSEGSPVVSPDGRFVAFASDRNGIDDLFRTRADGAGDVEELVRSSVRKYPTDWSLRRIVFTAFDAVRKQDLWVVDLTGAATPYLQTEFNERDGRLSPDERWMAYTSDEAGEDAVYVRPFPSASEGKWRVSGAGRGVAPRWRADGRELFYVDGGDRIMSVAIRVAGDGPVLGAPQALFQIDGLTRAQYEVSRDGTRFLLPVRSERPPGDAPLSIVLNWPTLLRRDQ